MWHNSPAETSAQFWLNLQSLYESRITVYRARDTKLDRGVAIKVLPGSLARDASRARPPRGAPPKVTAPPEPVTKAVALAPGIRHGKMENKRDISRT